jgi:hypothetical protein
MTHTSVRRALKLEQDAAALIDLVDLLYRQVLVDGLDLG